MLHHSAWGRHLTGCQKHSCILVLDRSDAAGNARDTQGWGECRRRQPGLCLCAKRDHSCWVCSQPHYGFSARLCAPSRMLGFRTHPCSGGF